MLYPANQLDNILEMKMFEKMFKDVTEMLHIQPIVLITKCNIDHKDFTINDIFESKKINSLIEQLQKHTPSISKSQIHPHISFKNSKDYPNDIKSALQLRVIEMATTQSELYLRRIFRNPIRIIDTEESEKLHVFYTDCIDEPISEMRYSGVLKSFIKIHGSNFKYIDKFGDVIPTEKEDNYSLQNILNLCPESENWKEFYIKKDQSMLQKVIQQKKSKKNKKTKKQKNFIEILNLNSIRPFIPIGFINAHLTEKMDVIRSEIVQNGIIPEDQFYVFMKLAEDDEYEILWDELESLETLNSIAKKKEKEIY